MSDKYTSLEHHIRSIMESASVPSGTAERRKVSIVGRPDDPPPTSPKSTLGKQGQIKTKIIDEEEVEEATTPVILNPELKNVNVDTLDTVQSKKSRLKKIVKETVKEDAATSIATKAAGKIGSKILPGIGLAYGAADAYDRYKKGDYTGAAMSGASAATSLVPGVGTAASLAIDAANLKRDYDAGEFSDKQPVSTAAAEPTQDKPAEPAKKVEPSQPAPKPIKKPVMQKKGI